MDINNFFQLPKMSLIMQDANYKRNHLILSCCWLYIWINLVTWGCKISGNFCNHRKISCNTDVDVEKLDDMFDFSRTLRVT